MTEPTLSLEAEAELRRLVDRVARPSSNGQLSYAEHLSQKLEQAKAKYNRKLDKARIKLGLGPSQAGAELAEEIQRYLADGVAEMMAGGASEADALQATKDKFDQAEAAPAFAGFATTFNDFDLVDIRAQAAAETEEWYAKHGEAIGLFYAAFLIMGIAGGALAGWLAKSSWLGAGAGAAAGAGCGIGLGLLSNAVMAARRRP